VTFDIMKKLLNGIGNLFCRQWQVIKFSLRRNRFVKEHSDRIHYPVSSERDSSVSLHEDVR